MKKTILALSLLVGMSSTASVFAALPQSIRIGKDFAFAGPSVKDKKYFGDGTGIGLRKDDAELKAAFDKALGEMRKDGTYDKMAKKYFDFNVYGD